MLIISQRLWLFVTYARVIYNGDMTKRKRPLSSSFELVLLFSAFAAVWVIGAVFYHLAEGLSLVDAIYFSAMTLTTVGYGDFAPQTDIGKIFTTFYALIGIGIFLGFAAALFQHVVGRIRRK